MQAPDLLLGDRVCRFVGLGARAQVEGEFGQCAVRYGGCGGLRHEGAQGRVPMEAGQVVRSRHTPGGQERAGGVVDAITGAHEQLAFGKHIDAHAAGALSGVRVDEVLSACRKRGADREVIAGGGLRVRPGVQLPGVAGRVSCRGSRGECETLQGRCHARHMNDVVDAGPVEGQADLRCDGQCRGLEGEGVRLLKDPLPVHLLGGLRGQGLPRFGSEPTGVLPGDGGAVRQRPRHLGMGARSRCRSGHVGPHAGRLGGSRQQIHGEVPTTATCAQRLRAAEILQELEEIGAHRGPPELQPNLTLQPGGGAEQDIAHPDVQVLHDGRVRRQEHGCLGDGDALPAGSLAAGKDVGRGGDLGVVPHKSIHGHAQF